MRAWTRGQRRPGPFKVFRRIDAEWHDIDKRHIDPHAVLDRAQLF